MLQLCWDPKHSRPELVELPSPGIAPGFLRVANAFSVISSGTERSGTKLSLSNPRALLKARPDLARKVMQMMRAQGVLTTLETVRTRLGALQPVGYSCAGIVEQVGDDTRGFAVGDRVACAGAGYAVHAEQVLVPRNLCASVPEGCDLESAAFATVGAIALQGFRLSHATVGDRVLVIGLGLIGQLTGRVALTAGCEVAGIDLDPTRIERLIAHGAHGGWTPSNVPPQGEFDAAIITAAATSSEPLVTAGKMVREKGRVVAVGLLPLEIPRDIYYQKEIEFVVSRSTGPGRYDPGYEDLGIDYPAAYVRWTQKRNMEAFLALIAQGKLTVSDLVSERVPISDGVRAYSMLRNPALGQLGLVLTYPTQPRTSEVKQVKLETAPARVAGSVRVGVIGAGKFARSVLLPAFQAAGAQMSVVCTRRPLEGRDVGHQFGFKHLVSEPEEVFRHSDIDAIVVATRHDSHAEFVRRAIESGKPVFVEKPLAVTLEQLFEIVDAAQHTSPHLLVGFNRRFAPLSSVLKEHFAGNEAGMMIHYRVNAGALPAEYWTQIPEIGGGRIVGEACHFIDWASYLADSLPVEVFATANRNRATVDDVSITVTMQNGAVASILYTASGGPSLSKERIEVFAAGRTAVVEDWTSARLGSANRVRSVKARGKGHREEVAAFIKALQSGGPMPISFESLQRTTEATFAALESLASRAPVRLPLARTEVAAAPALDPLALERQ